MRLDEGVEVVYSPIQMELLTKFRRRALNIIASFASRDISSYVHGSVARGDVNVESDIDIIIPYVVSSHTVELALFMHGFKIYSRRLAQATPSHALKAHIFLDEEKKECVTFPLVSFKTLESEFYIFGGILDYSSIKANKRVPGCDKRLMLIRPTELGHIEFSVKGREAEVARIIGVSPEIVKERIRVLTRRKAIGKTGIVLSVDVDEGEVFENVLRRLVASNPIVKRMVRSRR